MAANNKHDDPLAGLVAHTLGRNPDALRGDCPGADILAAYFDHSMTSAEADRWVLHFSSCARCQEQLATMARCETGAAPQSVSSHAPFWSWNWRWLAPAAAVLGVVTIWVVMRTDRQGVPARQAPVLQAENRQAQPAAKPPEIAAAGRDDEARKKVPVGSFDSKADASPKGTRENELRGPSREAAESAPASKLAALEPQGVARTPGVTGPVKPQIDLPAAVAGQVSDKVDQSQSEKRREEQPLAQIPRDSDLQKLEAAQTEKESKKALDAKPAAAQEQIGAATMARTVTSPAPAAGLRAPPSGERDRAATQFGFTAPGILVPSPTKKTVWRLWSSGRIDRSTDAGNTWVTQESLVEVPLFAGSAPSDSVCWTVGRGVVLRTTNGQTWEKLTPPVDQDITTVRAQDALSAVVGTPAGVLYSTTDGGRSWRKL